MEKECPRFYRSELPAEVVYVQSHELVWEALDALAARYSLSPSGLAKRAGLDPSAFNRSKRYSGDGRPRWPSTESLAKVFEATGASWLEFTRLMEGGPVANSHYGIWTQDRVARFAETTAARFVSDDGHLVRDNAHRLDMLGPLGADVYVLEVRGSSMLPVYRDGDIIIVDPSAPVKQGNRTVLHMLGGEVLIGILIRSDYNRIELLSLHPEQPSRVLERGSVERIARIVWASQ